jgi:UDP-N-acetylglucosamine 2-epimerase (non-hydrolysing)
MSPVIKELSKRDGIESVVCVTAQHRQMLDQVLSAFNIVPDYDLNIMQESQSLSEITVHVLSTLDLVVKEVAPDIILVHGDTTTTFAASLCAFYNGVLLGHVEAGLRTYNKHSPFPEEVNRQLTSVVADFHFAPTEYARDNLIREGKDPEKIIVTGNTAIDALSTTILKEYTHPLIESIGDDRMILFTAHRRENIGDIMSHIFRSVLKIVEEFNDVHLVYPVHLNPLVRKLAYDVFGDDENRNPRIHLLEPLDVIDFHNFMARSYFIMSDSGGIQEEAPSLGKPVLVLRDTTERPEGVRAGTLKLTGLGEDDVYNTAKILLEDREVYESMANSINPYGDGHSSEYIVDYLEKYFSRYHFKW